LTTLCVCLQRLRLLKKSVLICLSSRGSAAPSAVSLGLRGEEATYYSAAAPPSAPSPAHRSMLEEAPTPNDEMFFGFSH
jgi:hypothetical protein